MTSERRFDQDLPDLLAQVAQAPAPDYRDSIVQRTTRTRQRPAWTFSERWLPMSVVTSRAATVPRFPLRIVAVVALLLIALIVGAGLFAGSQRHLPAPFGLAVAGRVAYAKNGDIYTADPVTGKARAIVTGDAQDSDPVWSRDGTMLAFVHQTDTGQGQLMVAAADGSGLRPITQALPGIGVHGFKDAGHVNLAFSPDGQEVAFTAGDRPMHTLWVADVRQGVARQLNLGTNLHPDGEPSWMPPAGDEILFNGLLGSQSGLYAVDVHSGKVRPIVEPSPRFGAGVSTVSPDGSRIAYTQIDNQVTDRNPYQVHIVNSDGSGDVALPMPTSAMFQDLPVWSNDGKRLVIVRGYAAHAEDVRLAIMPADGANTGVETKPSISGCCDYAVDWSPDDSRILFLPEDLTGTMTSQLLIDSSTGALTDASWGGISVPAWQRLAP